MSTGLTEPKLPLEQQIETDLRTAMSAKDACKVSVLRFLKSAIKYVAIEKKLPSLDEADIRQVIQKQIKQRRESIEQFSKAGRADLSEKESVELILLEAYLPQQMPDNELEAFVKSEAASAGAVSKKDFGRMMKLLNEKLKGRADSSRLSRALGNVLQ